MEFHIRKGLAECNMRIAKAVRSQKIACQLARKDTAVATINCRTPTSHVYRNDIIKRDRRIPKKLQPRSRTRADEIKRYAMLVRSYRD